MGNATSARPGGDGKCPQGCRHPVAGRETVEYREEVEPLDTPRVVDAPGGGAVITERTHRYAECIVCGWGYSL